VNKVNKKVIKNTPKYVKFEKITLWTSYQIYADVDEPKSKGMSALDIILPQFDNDPEIQILEYDLEDYELKKKRNQ
jgi:hypothetical protein